MKRSSEFKVNEVVRIGSSHVGFDLARIVEIKYDVWGKEFYKMIPVTQNEYLRDPAYDPYTYHSPIFEYYCIKDVGWIIEHVMNGVEKFKKIYEKIQNR